MKKNKNKSYGKIYNIASSHRRIIAGVIGGILAFVMIVGVVASAFS